MIRLMVLLLGITFLIAQPTHAATKQAGLSAATGDPAVKEQVAFGVQTPQHLEVALLTAHEMLDGKGVSASRVDIVACGKAAQALQAGGDLQPAIQQYLKRGGRVVACGISLDRLKLDAKTLVPGVEIVANAFTELIRLQIAGFRTLVL